MGREFDYETIGEQLFDFDLSSSQSLDLLQLKESIKRPGLWYLFDTSKNCYCEHFTISKSERTRKKLRVLFFRKEEEEKLSPTVTLLITNIKEKKESNEVRSRVALDTNETHIFLGFLQFLQNTFKEICITSCTAFQVTKADTQTIQMAEELKSLDKPKRIKLLSDTIKNLSEDDLNAVLGRKKALNIFDKLLNDQESFNKWLEKIKNKQPEKLWQLFFEKESWIFGLALQLKFLEPVEREFPIPTERADRIIIDFLMQSDYTATVEIKLPSTPLFSQIKNRSGAWKLSSELNDAISQVLEQKAEWSSYAHNLDSVFTADKKKQAIERTRDSSAFLVIGSKKTEQAKCASDLEWQTKRDTFELLRNNMRNVQIVTYDELFDRASAIISTSAK